MGAKITNIRRIKRSENRISPIVQTDDEPAVSLRKTRISFWTNAGRFFRNHMRQYISFGFLFMLCLSFIMWYIIKLDGIYTATVPITVIIDNKEVGVEAVVSGKGERIFSYRYYWKRPIEITLRELETYPSAVNPDSFAISAYSLQNAISRHITDLQIISLGPIPEISYD